MAGSGGGAMVTGPLPRGTGLASLAAETGPLPRGTGLASLAAETGPLPRGTGLASLAADPGLGATASAGAAAEGTCGANDPVTGALVTEPVLGAVVAEPVLGALAGSAGSKAASPSPVRRRSKVSKLVRTHSTSAASSMVMSGRSRWASARR